MVCVAKKIAHLIDEASKKGCCLQVFFQKSPYSKSTILHIDLVGNGICTKGIFRHD